MPHHTALMAGPWVRCMQRALMLSLIVLLAGCTSADNEGPTAGDKAADAVDDAPVSLDRPTWAVGDWWTFTGSDGTARTWIVTDAADGYVVDIDADDFAFTDAALSDISTIGKISLDLDGVQDGKPVTFFDWPLTDGKTWSLEWDGMPFIATATVTEDRADIEAVSGGVVRNYSFDNKTGWFSTVESYANGTLQWGMTQTASGTGYSGTYLRYAIHGRDAVTLDGNLRNTGGVLIVPAETTDIWYSYNLVCSTGQIQYALQPPAPTTEGLIISSACPIDLATTGTLAPLEGSWRSGLSATGVSGTIDVVARTLEEYRL